MNFELISVTRWSKTIIIFYQRLSNRFLSLTKGIPDFVKYLWSSIMVRGIKGYLGREKEDEKEDTRAKLVDISDQSQSPTQWLIWGDIVVFTKHHYYHGGLFCRVGWSPACRAIHKIIYNYRGLHSAKDLATLSYCGRSHIPSGTLVCTLVKNSWILNKKVNRSIGQSGFPLRTPPPAKPCDGNIRFNWPRP